jgi:hypothetical protein
VFGLFVMVIVLLLKVYIQLEFSQQIESLLALPKKTKVAVLVMMLIFLGVFAVGLGYRLILHYCYGIRWKIAPKGTA